MKVAGDRPNSFCAVATKVLNSALPISCRCRSEISASISEAAFAYLDGPIMRVTGPDVPSMPYNHNQEEAFMPNPEKILHAMKELAAY